MRLHVHWTRSRARVGTYLQRRCRCGAVQLTRYASGRATWSSSWGPTRAVYRQAMHG